VILALTVLEVVKAKLSLQRTGEGKVVLPVNEEDVRGRAVVDEYPAHIVR